MNVSSETSHRNPWEEENPQIRLRLDHIADWETRVVEARYSAKALCERCGFSMRHVQRFMIKRFRMNLKAFVAAVRMGKAYNLLKRGFSIKETSVGLGFKQVSHFCRCFKQHYRANASEVILNAGSSGAGGGMDDSQLELEFLRPEPRGKQGASKRRGKAKKKA